MRRAGAYVVGDLRRDLIAGIALAAIAIPSQIATAHLAKFPPTAGLIAFAAATAGFAALGANRFLVVCADSTIAPIFAGGLAALTTVGSQDYFGLTSSFAVILGSILFCIGFFRLGWLADLASIPVSIGFLAGIAAHIVISQLPFLLGVSPPNGSLLERLSVLARLSEANQISLALGLGVLGVIVSAELLSRRIPGALLGLVAATAAVYWFSLERAGVAVLGHVPGELPHPRIPASGIAELVQAAPLALIVAAVAMVQTAATTRSFNACPEGVAAIDRDFAGVGAANLLAGFLGTFPVDASPPLTESIAASGRRSRLPSLAAAAIVLGMAGFGTKLLMHVPMAGIAGVLIFIAMRIVRVREILTIFRRAPGEFVLIVATFAAIIILPVGTGVAIGIVLSLLHGMWSLTRARVIVFERVPGTTIWWPPGHDLAGERVEGVLVIAFQAPLSFLNAYEFQAGVRKAIRESAAPISLIVLEGSSIVEIDFTAAQVLLSIVEECARREITFAVARLESLRAQEAFERFGITRTVTRDRLFRSVDEAIRTLTKKTNEFRQNS